MPTISDKRKNELAQLFMDRKSDLYRKSFSKEPFDNLIDQLYRRGFTINSHTYKLVRETSMQLSISVIESSDFFKEVLVTISERVLKHSRGIKN